MANAFDTDPNCVSAFLFESGAFTEDAVGTATLNTYVSYGAPPAIDTGTFWEGAASAYQDQYNYDPFYVDNEPADFPLHYNSGVTTFSVTMAYYQTGAGEDLFYLLRKHNSFGFWITYLPGSAYVTIGVDVYGDTSYEEALTLESGRWYHIGLTFDAATKTCNIRVYDANTEDIQTFSHTFANAPVDNSNDLYIGDYYSADTSYLDEVAFFKDVLTDDEIDQIRAQTYGSGGEGGEQTTGSGGEINTFLLGCSF